MTVLCYDYKCYRVPSLFWFFIIFHPPYICIFFLNYYVWILLLTMYSCLLYVFLLLSCVLFSFLHHTILFLLCNVFYIPYEFFFVYVTWVFILFYDFSFITYAFSSLRTTILAISIRYLLLFTWHFPRYVRYFLFFPYDISYVLSLSFLRPTEHLMSANTA